MITHDEAKEKALFLHGKYDEAYKTLNDYITQQEQFAKDVKRYFELQNKYYKIIVCGHGEWNNTTDIEYKTLKQKLSKVGK